MAELIDVDQPVRGRRILVPAFQPVPDGRSREARQARAMPQLAPRAARPVPSVVGGNRLDDIRRRLAQLPLRSPEYMALAAEAEALENEAGRGFMRPPGLRSDVLPLMEKYQKRIIEPLAGAATIMAPVPLPGREEVARKVLQGQGLGEAYRTTRMPSLALPEAQAEAVRRVPYVGPFLPTSLGQKGALEMGVDPTNILPMPPVGALAKPTARAVQRGARQVEKGLQTAGRELAQSYRAAPEAGFARIPGGKAAKPPSPIAAEVAEITTPIVQAPEPDPVAALEAKLRASKSRNSLRVSKDLDDLEKQGYDVEEARQALSDYKETVREDFDSAEDFAEVRAEAWDEFLDAISSIIAPEAPEFTPPMPKAPEVAPPLPQAPSALGPSVTPTPTVTELGEYLDQVRGAKGTAEIRAVSKNWQDRFPGGSEPVTTQVAGEPPVEPPKPPAPPPAGPPLPEGEPLPERGFITHTAKSPMGSDVLRKLYDEEPIVYSPITNKGTLERAAGRVQADPLAARAAVMAETPLDPDTMVDTMAQGLVLMRRAATEGNVTELRDLSRRIAERLTPSAQAIQLASTIDKLSPEGLFVYTQRLMKKAIEKGQGSGVAQRVRAATRKVVVQRETQEAADDVAKARMDVTQAKMNLADATRASKEAAPPPGQAAKQPSGNQRARDLAYLIDDSVREVRAQLTEPDRQAIIQAKAILKRSVAEMDEATATDFLDRAAALRDLPGEARLKAIKDLVEEVRKLPQVQKGVAEGGVIKPNPELLKQLQADLTWLTDRTVRNQYANLNTVDRLAIARLKELLRRTDVELPQGMAEQLLAETSQLRGLKQADQPAALDKFIRKIKEYDPIAQELARKKNLADAEARARQMARQAAADLSKLIDPSVKRVGKTVTPEERKAVAGAVAILRRYDVRLPEDKAKDFLAKAKALNTLPEGEQTAARRSLVNEINRFDPIARRKSIAEAEERVRKDTLQVARDLEALIGEEPQRATRPITPADRAAIVQAKAVLRKYGARLPNDMAVDFLQKAKALRTLPPEEQLAARQSLINEIKSFDPVKLAMEEAAANRQRIAARRQSAKDLAYLAHAALRVSQARLRNVERDAIRSAKARLKDAGVEMPEELAQSFLDRARALRIITDEYDQRRAAQSLMADVHSLIPPSKMNKVLDIIGLPRIFQASYDTSFALRQGVMHAWGYPIEWGKMVKTGLQAFASEDVAQAADRAYFNRPLYGALDEAGLDYVDRWGTIGQQEETIMSSWAERTPGVKQSNRTYITQGNMMRTAADSDVMRWLPDDIRTEVASGAKKFETLDELVAVTGRTRQDFERLAQWHNVLTGRGDLGNFLKFNNHWLNGLFYAPRFAVSRVEVPVLALRNFVQNPALRRVVAKELAASVVGSTVALYMVSQLPGVQVEWNPLSSDFRKARYRSLRVDLDGGFNVLIRQMTQLATGKRKSVTTGQVEDVSRLKVLLGDYLLNKLSPIGSFGADVLDPTGTFRQTSKQLETAGDWAVRAAEAWIPFVAQDTLEAVTELGPAGVAVAPLSAAGASVSAYGPGVDWSKELKPYFAIPAIDKQARAQKKLTRGEYREANPEIDAKLYLAGIVESLEAGEGKSGTWSGRKAVVRLMRENKVNPKEIPGLQPKEFESDDRKALRLWILRALGPAPQKSGSSPLPSSRVPKASGAGAVNWDAYR